MKVLAIGASRNSGYYASLRLLERGDTVTFLLRSIAVFDKDTAMAAHIASGKARLVQGDATKEEDVRRAWVTACVTTYESSPSDEGQVDALMITIGVSGKLHPLKGYLIDPHNICSVAILNALSTCPESATPRIIAVTSTGLGRSLGALPLVYRPLYRWGLGAQHADKLGLERVLHHVGGRKWTEREPGHDMLHAEWEKRLPSRHFQTAIVRPAVLTHGVCTANYRVGDGDIISVYTVSRRDVSHFIVEGILTDWDKWQGKTISMAY